ncbi:MAG TPA: DUF3160 domain-containing protein, partial [Bacteroidota bacterium]|nr:DUF3160 domain-containing protein [Bacteroidota bacterium]
MNSRHVVMLATVFANALVQAQVTPTFDVEAYRRFLSAHQNLSTTQLLELHPAGVFQKAIGYDPTAAIYFSNIDSLCQLTTDERALLQKHGFVVSERLSRKSFGDAFVEIFHRDLPVFVSTDAILHAMHMSYDVMLKKIELSTLIPDLDSLLSGLHKQLPVLVSTYENIPEMRQSLSDVDVYLSVARALLGATVAPTFPENWTTISGLLSLVQSLQPADYALFSTQRRTIDFSQFKVRGHYTQHPELEKYFQAMMWLGRTELYLISPEVDGLPTQADNNIQRQTIDAMLVLEALEGVQDSTRFNRIDQVIQLFVGESDNVTIANLRALRQLTGIQRASDLTDTLRFGEFRETLRQQAYAFQRILSQIFISDPYNPDQIHPAAAFLLFGQRFVIDSYISANVVYDRIIYNNEKIKRMLPMPLDVLFPLGNNAAAQLLEPEVDLYHYGSNLASLRYLVDAYDEQFWKGTLYNGWLQSIRALSPPTNRNSLPAFMQTAAWWQEKMNTQLASWAQLRHDNLLYAKQSYSGGIVCSFPESYVEPIPQFYAAVKTYAEEGVSKLTELGIHQPVEYFRFL